MKSLFIVYKNYPNGYTVNYRLGWLSYRGGHFADALDYYKKALGVYPASLEVMVRRIEVFVAQQKWSLVEEESRKALRISYYNRDVNYWLALSLRINGKFKEAINQLNDVTAIFPTNTSLLTQLALAYKASGDEITAIKIFSNILILDPYNQTALEAFK